MKKRKIAEVYLGVRIPRSHKEVLERQALELNTTVSRIIRRLVGDEVARYKRRLGPQHIFTLTLAWLEAKGIIDGKYGPGKYTATQVLKLFDDAGVSLLDIGTKDILPKLEELASNAKGKEIIAELNKTVK